MRTPFAWTLPSQISLRALWMCCALWGVPAAALAAEEQIGGVLSDRRVLALLAMGGVLAAACLVGMLAGWSGRGPRQPRLRLLNKPRKTHLSVLVPPGPAPRLIPSESPNAKRARPARAPVPRQTPDGITGSGIVDYIAPFAESAEAIDERRVDYLLELGASSEKPLDPPGESEGSLRDAG